MKPRLLDLFCGAGGAAMGYSRAGFDVVGVDIKPQPHYPFQFIQSDVMSWRWDAFARGFYNDRGTVHGHFSIIHASPPCQAFSTLRTIWKDRQHPDLVGRTRELLQATGLPWVIENVPAAPIRADLMLCGSMFDLGARCHDGTWRQLRRHRIFETHNQALIFSPGPCIHIGQPVGVYGHGGGGQMTRGYKGTMPEYQEAMGIYWATKAEIAQAIPPAYTEWLGLQLIKTLEVAA